jgi:pre-peptidase
MRAQRTQLATVALAAGIALLVAGHAPAATPPTGSVGPSNPSVTWQGQEYASTTPDPRFCTSQAIDPINLICDHFTLDVGAPGSVTVTIGWPSAEHDFDLYVCQLDPEADVIVADACTGGREVARSDAVSGTSETATFTAPAAGTYEVRVVPIAVSSATAYTGSATYAASGGGPVPFCSSGTIHVVLPGLVDVCVSLGIGAA